MNCPTCGYLMEQTDLECPRCKLMAVKAAVAPVAQKPIQPAQGTTPQNPVYVKDPYVSALAKAKLESAELSLRILWWVVSFVLSTFIAAIAASIVAVIIGEDGSIGAFIGIVVGIIVLVVSTKKLFDFGWKKFF